MGNEIDSIIIFIGDYCFRIFLLDEGVEFFQVICFVGFYLQFVELMLLLLLFYGCFVVFFFIVFVNGVNYEKYFFYNYKIKKACICVQADNMSLLSWYVSLNVKKWIGMEILLVVLAYWGYGILD